MNHTQPQILSAGTITGDEIHNPSGEKLGELKEIMLDMDAGRVAYAVLSFGGFLGMGDKLFAIPWEALRLDAPNHAFVLDVSKETLENAPGFDKDHWPQTSDYESGWLQEVYDYYGYPQYERNTTR